MERHIKVKVDKKFRNGDIYWFAVCIDRYGRVGEAEHNDLQEAQINSVIQYYRELYKTQPNLVGF